MFFMFWYYRGLSLVWDLNSEPIHVSIELNSGFDTFAAKCYCSAHTSKTWFGIDRTLCDLYARLFQ